MSKLVICIFLCSSSLLLYGQVPGNERITVNCMVLDANRKSVNLSGKSIEIFESGENTRFDEQAQKRYYYIPSFYISKYVADSGRQCQLFLNIAVDYPEQNDIMRYIQGNVNAEVRASNINPLCLLGYSINCSKSLAIYTVDTRAGLTLSPGQSLGAVLKFGDKALLRETIALLRSGISGIINIECLIGMKLTVAGKCELNESTIAHSEVYREFFSPVEGKKIWVVNNKTGEAAMQKEIIARCTKEINAGMMNGHDIYSNMLYRQLDTFMNLFLNDHASISRITFDEIEKGVGAAKDLVDFKDNRYATNLVRKMAYNAKNLSNNEWETYYNNTRNDVLRKNHINNTEAGGGGWFKAFGLKGKYSKATEDLLNKESDRMLLDAKKFKEALENSVEYEKEGEEWIPKAIICKDVLSQNYTGRSNAYTRILLVDQANDKLPINLKLGNE